MNICKKCGEVKWEECLCDWERLKLSESAETVGYTHQLRCWKCGSEMKRTGRRGPNGEDAACVNTDNCLHTAVVPFILGYWAGFKDGGSV